MKTNDLTQGKIYPQLVELALPLMATALIQMSYNLMDMFWLGMLHTHSLAATAAAGYISWLAMAFVLMLRTGTEIGVGHSVGARDQTQAKSYISTALASALLLGALYGLVVVLIRRELIGLFPFKEDIIREQAYSYLMIVALGYPFFFINPIIGAIYHGAGDSRTPFLANAVGLVTNMVLDPVFIFVLDMGVEGAALATALANFIVSLIFFIIRKKAGLISGFHLIKDFSRERFKQIVSWGYPSAVYNIFFVSVSTVVSRQVTQFSSGAFAAYEVGVQIEAIGWMMFGGLSTAVGAFTAQNFGAKNYDRLKEGYIKGTRLTSSMGLFAMVVLFVFSRQLMGLFIRGDSYALEAGINYLKITALVQILQSWEASAQGGFNGIGKTKLPSVVGILSNLSRIPLSYILKGPYGLSGIWLALAISAASRGIFIRLMFYFEKSKLEMDLDSLT